MTHSQEARVSSSQDSLRLSEENISTFSALVNNKLNSCAGIGTEVLDDEKQGKGKATSNQEEKKMEAVFPWLKGFGELQRSSSVGCTSIKILENLLSVYLQHVSIDVRNCYMKPNRAAKLKKCMCEALLFFHLQYQDVREPMEHSFYLNKMTDLMSMYMDMEIKASRRRKETTTKIVGRVTTYLQILLDHSERHILDSILKAKLITSANRELCEPILRKILSNLPVLKLHELMYVRRVLAFKLWKKIVKEKEEKKRMSSSVLQKLPVPNNFEQKAKLFSDVLPRTPKSNKNISLFFMQAKFNLKVACKAFLKMCKESQPLGDKALLYGENVEETPTTTVMDKVDVGGGWKSNMFNTIWSSLSESSVTERSQIKAVTGDKEKADTLSGKKQKSQNKREKKLKNKSKAQKNTTLGINKNKNKKKDTSKTDSDGMSVLDNVTTDNIRLIQISEKENAKRKKSYSCNEIADEAPVHNSDIELQVQEERVSSEEQSVAVKTEDVSVTAVVGEENQVNKINSVTYVGEIEVVGTRENSEVNTASSNEMPPVAQTGVVQEVINDSEQVNQINSACSEVGALEAHKNVTDLCTVGVVRSGVQVRSANSVIEEGDMNQVNHVSAGTKDSVCDAVVSAVTESVIVPTSSTVQLDCLVNSSHKSQSVATVENEAVACSENENMSSTGMTTAKVICPYLVSSRVCEGSGAQNIITQREEVSYVCDSSIKLEDPIQEVGYVGVSGEVPIPKEGYGGVDNDFFNRMYGDIDSDVEILADLRPQQVRHCNIPEEGREEVLLRNENDLIPRDSVPSNIFATENSELFIEALDGVLPVTSIDLESREVVVSDDGTVGSPFFGGDEGTELECPAIETLDDNEKRSLACMMNNIRSAKDKETFARFGMERQDWYKHTELKYLYSDALFGTVQSTHSHLVPIHEHAFADSRQDDDDDHEKGGSTDDDAESCYEYHSSSSSSSPRQRLGGGKVGSSNFISPMNEKEVSDSSPSSNVSDSLPTVNNACLKNRDLFSKIKGGSLLFSDRNARDRPQSGLKTPAPGIIIGSHYSPTPTTIVTTAVAAVTTTTATTVRSTTSTRTTAATSSTKRGSTISVVTAPPTLKRLNVSLKNCIDEKSLSDQNKLNRTPRFTSDDKNVAYVRTNVQVSTNRFPDVVRDAHNATRKCDKGAAPAVGPQKTSSRGTLSSESGNKAGGKSVKSNIEGLYQNVPIVETESHAPSIPYPTIPTPSTIVKSEIAYRPYLDSTCYQWYVNPYPYIPSYSNSQEDSRMYQVPIQCQNSGSRTEVEALKYRDEELMKMVEASLEDSKYKLNLKGEDFDSTYKCNLDSSLPLKKRLKTLTHIEQSKIKSEFVEASKSLQAESFPSYPSKPMISIAELELNSPMVNYKLDVPKSVRSYISNMQKYPHYDGPSFSYENIAQPAENFLKRMDEAHFIRQQYAPERTEISKNVCKVERSEEILHNPGMGNVPVLTSVSETRPHDRKCINNRDTISMDLPNALSNNSSNDDARFTDRPFKTPVELKETAVPSRNSSVIKSELPNNNSFPPPSLISFVKDKPIGQVPTSQAIHYANTFKKDTVITPIEVNMCGRQTVLDLSTHALKENKTHRNSRRKRNDSDVKPRHSKRSKRETVIQNSETIDNSKIKCLRKRNSHIPR